MQILVPGDTQVSWNQIKNFYPSVLLPYRHNLPWLTKEITQLIRKRDLYFKRARHGTVTDRAKFRELRNRVLPNCELKNSLSLLT